MDLPHLPFRHRGGTRSQAQAAAPDMVLTDEQLAAAAATGRSTVVNACPGAGARVTIAEYVSRNEDAIVLEQDGQSRAAMAAMLLHRGIAGSAMNTFPVHTFHSWAYRYMIALDSRYGNVEQHLRPWDLMFRYNVTDRIAGLACRALARFFVSSEPGITVGMFAPADAVDVFAFQRAGHDEVERAMSLARQAWQDMKEGRLAFSLDGLFKLYVEIPDQPSHPKLPFAHIVINGAHEMTGAMLKLLKSQRHATQFFVGDKHRSIVGYHGNVGALDQLAEASDTFDLTQSFTRSQSVVEVASAVLNGLMDAYVQMTSRHLQSDAETSNGAIAYLARGNGALLEKAVELEGEGIYWLNHTGYVEAVQSLLDVYYLGASDRAAMKSQFYRSFESLDLLEQYANASGDLEAGSLVKLVRLHGSEVPAIAGRIRSNAIAEVHDPAMRHVFSTVHQARAQQWNVVELADDFQTCREAAAEIQAGGEPEVQEIRLLYVAATRARRALRINADLRDWLDDKASQAGLANRLGAPVVTGRASRLAAATSQAFNNT